MTKLISQVGFQPGAVACTAYTLRKAGLIDQTCLLVTKESLAFIDTLAKVLLGWGITTQIVQIGYGNSYDSEPIRLEKAVTTILDSNNTDTPPIIDVTPGLNYQIGLLSRSLRDRDDYIPVYAGYRFLHQLGKSEKRWPLQDISTDCLFRLHGLKPVVGRFEGNVWRDIEFENTKNRLKVDAVIEIRGKLRAVVDLDRSGNPLQEARRLKRLLRVPAILNQLQPHFCITTRNPIARKRLQAYSGFYLPESSTEDLTDWIVKKMHLVDSWPLPGYKAAGKGEFRLEGRQMVKGGGGHGPPLVTCLGNDPSATLVAIHNQRPSHLILCYDQSTPYIQCLAGRLSHLAAKLPVEEILFEPTNQRGTGLIDQLLSVISRIKSRPENWLVNITPGTKAQTWELAQLPGTSLYSILHGDSVPLLGRTKTIFTSQATPLLTQATCCGGRLKPSCEKKTAELLNNGQKEFLEIMLSFISEISKKLSILAELQWAPGKEFSSIWKSTTGGRKQFVVRCTGAGSGYLSFTVSRFFRKHGDKVSTETKYKGFLPGPVKTGYWLEPLVAYAFIRHHSKLINEVLIGVEWDWLDVKPTRNSSFRTEIDVILLWRGKPIAISCKTSLKKGRFTAREEITAVARTGLGHFCLPVLVYPMKENQIENEYEPKIENGVLEIPISRLSNAAYLKNALDTFAGFQHTTKPVQNAC